MEQSHYDMKRILIPALSFIGMLIMTYLLYSHYAPIPEGGSFCDLGKGFSCDVVNKSAYSEIYGIPMAGFSVLYFGLILVLSIFRYTTATLSFITLLLIALLGPSLYLSIMSKMALNSICILCESSKALMILIAVLAASAAGIKNIGMQKIIIALALAVALASMVYLAHSLTVTDPFILPPNPLPFL